MSKLAGGFTLGAIFGIGISGTFIAPNEGWYALAIIGLGVFLVVSGTAGDDLH